MTSNTDVSNTEKIKIHFQKNKKLYFGIGIGVVVTLAIRKPVVINNIPVFNNIVNNGGHMRKIVRCLETDEIWTSVSKAATAAGSSLPMMSRHLNGHKDHINGLHYVIEGLASG